MIATILLQVPASAEEPVSTLSIVLFWAIAVLCVVAFFYFLKRTDRIIAEEAAASNKPVEADSKLSHNDVHEEEAAAIALAIHMYKSQMHDQDNFTITLRKVSRIYSPWSSKIYTLRQNPRH
jgi:type III secretory pathway component EscV